jgi:hypothetical protein
MKAALRGHYIEFVFYNGVTEKYPTWFEEELYECVYTDESRYTFWVPREERRPDYYEKQLIEDYSVFLRKPNGEIHLTDFDVFNELYDSFRYDAFTNSGIAAFREDCIEYVECKGGVLSREYPFWFYEFFTEAVNLPQGETIYFHDHNCGNTTQGPFLEVSDDGQVSVDAHSVFLRNKHGEIKGMLYSDFIKFWDDDPKLDPRGGFIGD